MESFVAPEPFDSPSWLFEPDWGGLRVLAYVGKGTAAFKLGGGRDVTHRFPEPAQALAEAVTVDGVVLDGDLITLDSSGHPVGSAAGKRPKPSTPSISFHARDILYHAYRPVLDRSLTRRKSLLGETLAPNQRVQIAYVQQGLGCVFFEAALNLGMDGIYAKRRSSAYLPGERSRSWLRIQERRALTAVVGGYTLAPGRGRGFDAILIGAFDGARLRYLGQVSGGFSPAEAREFARLLPAAQTSQCPFSDPPHMDRLFYWCKPQTVVEVEYGELGPQGRLRFSKFAGLHHDVTPEDCSIDGLLPRRGSSRSR